MTDPHDYDHEGLCRRCGIGEAWAEYRPFCTPMPSPPEPERAPPAPAIADMLGRALGQSAWDRLDRKHKP